MDLWSMGRERKGEGSKERKEFTLKKRREIVKC